MKRFMTYAKNRRGITIVMIALMLFVLLALLGLAVDIATMYFSKNQLQVAADAAALAGAALLHDNLASSDYTIQSAARDEAIKFAAKNKAGNRSVLLVTDGSNNLSEGAEGSQNDITVGNWNSDLTPQYLAGRLPINAIEVRPQKMAGLSGDRGPIRVFIGQVFRFIGADWSRMSARATAIATKPPRASSFITLCLDACYEGGTSCIYPNDPCPLSPRILSRNPGTPNAEAFAWTSLLDHITSSADLAPLICETNPYVNLCGHEIWTTQGETSTPKKFESAMFDPSYDTRAKDCMSSTGVVGNCSIVTGPVVGWTIIIPIVTAANCPPAEQPYPLDVYGYASIHVKAVCAPGVGHGALCPDRPFSAPAAPCASCGGSIGNNCIIIDRIQCISCADADGMPGLRPVLVK